VFGYYCAVTRCKRNVYTTDRCGWFEEREAGIKGIRRRNYAFFSRVKDGSGNPFAGPSASEEPNGALAEEAKD